LGYLTLLLHKGMVESAAYHHKKAVSTTLPPAQAPPQLPAQRALQPGRAKALSYIFDGLVKSHIPHVVHASTKPVLSERSKGDADFLRVHHICRKDLPFVTEGFRLDKFYGKYFPKNRHLMRICFETYVCPSGSNK
jgi:hypothetical protein